MNEDVQLNTNYYLKFYNDCKNVIMHPKTYYLSFKDSVSARDSFNFLMINICLNAFIAFLFSRFQPLILIITMVKLFAYVLLISLFSWLLLNNMGAKGKIQQHLNVVNYATAPLVFAFILPLNMLLNGYFYWLIYHGFLNIHEIEKSKVISGIVSSVLLSGLSLWLISFIFHI